MNAPASLLPLRIEDVCFEAGGHRIIEGVSLEMGAGARTVILGPNGAGKSVLLRICHGLLAPTSGRVTWNVSQPAGGRRRQAMVFQRPVMLRRSALANVAYGLKLAGMERHERQARAQRALDDLGLAHLAGRSARVLSGGEQQRLALARAWALEPEVLFLDEPTANLDPGATGEVEAAIANIGATGTKIIMVTHDLGAAKRLADEIVFLHNGRVLERTDARRFFNGPASREAAAFVQGELL
ncbi:MAG: ABC transporter ATP-binding protein [Betaproteobacteria bacterium RIFCSPLOWO2_12_FULL_62_13b]|nr:MAG: ABC transporter ATP-binding protein [Betaproteobacteria bacterium RIFCSPLOWO2_12_FULL_62_13b]